MVLAGSGRISPVPPYSGYRPGPSASVYGAVTRYGRAFQTRSTSPDGLYAGPTTPRCMHRGLGYPAFARHYLRGHWFVFLSSGYLDVSVPRVAVPTSRDGAASRHRVAPFGHPRIKGCLHLPVAFRSLPRPSSSLGAKASPIRPCLLPVLGTGPLGPVMPCRAPRTPWCAWRLLAARSCFPLPALSMNFPQLHTTLKKGRHFAACGHRRSDPAARPPLKDVPVYLSCISTSVGKPYAFPLWWRIRDSNP